MPGMMVKMEMKKWHSETYRTMMKKLRRQMIMMREKMMDLKIIGMITLEILREKLKKEDCLTTDLPMDHTTQCQLTMLRLP